MNIREVTDILIRAVSGGNNPVDSKWEAPAVEAMIPNLREKAMKMEYNGSRTQAASKRIDYAWLNPQFTVQKNNSLQDKNKDYIVFEVPKPASINKLVDGFIYVGQDDDSISFKKMSSRESIAIAKQRGFLRNGKDIAYIWQQPYLEVYGNNALTEINVRMICSNPADAPNFDLDTDEYPITESVLFNMIELFKLEMSVSINKLADTIVDDTETYGRNVTNQNTKG